jgi:hypothetical protein
MPAPVGSNLELTLLKYVQLKGFPSGTFVAVAVSGTPQSRETVNYIGRPVWYYWRVSSRSGGGNYTSRL